MTKQRTQAEQYWNLKEELLSRIKQNGGWVNCHAHIDRAYTITPERFDLFLRPRSEKWALNDQLRIESTVDQIYDRMARAVERLLEQGVVALATYIDVDGLVKDKSIQAAIRLRERYGSELTLKFLNQTSHGLFDVEKESRKWFDVAAEFVDILGGLPKADLGREEEYFDIVLGTAKRLGKMAHIHVDELNLPEEHETELLAKKVIEHGMQGRVAGIHGISINCRPQAERQRIYQLLNEAQMMMISCPVSWMNERRSEELAPIHNPLTPVDELVPAGITVGIGSDNIADIWMPYNDADMWLDLRALLEMARFYDLDKLTKIATTNGRKILGIR
jgi:cytosine/adenosine deaminase-related metal-dependent hydrolase